MSASLAIVNQVARYLVRPLLGLTADPTAARRDFERVTALLPLPKGVHVDETDQGWLRIVPNMSSTAATILYFHGGAYITGSPKTHRRLGALLALETGADVLLPKYRLAPEHPAPAAFEDGLAAYCDTILNEPNLVIGGDSAGGGLAFAVLAALPSGVPRPKGIFAFSPWADLSLHAAERWHGGDTDRLLPVERFDEVCAFLGDQIELSDPRVSPARAVFDQPPPALIQVAKSEALHLDACRLSTTLREAGADVTLSELADAPHVWQMLDLVLPEARESLAEVGRFIRALPV